MFIWIDLRRYLLPSLKYTDAELPNLLTTSPKAHIYRKREAWFVATCLRNGVSVGLGSNFFTEELGWFRITFAVKREALKTGLERVAKSIREMEDQHWDSSTVPIRDRILSGKDEVSI
jgi:bifunctional pyridoxal-dependent enzyme with beta-cystathionase and maltose regulon repressor activities